MSTEISPPAYISTDKIPTHKMRTEKSPPTNLLTRKIPTQKDSHANKPSLREYFYRRERKKFFGRNDCTNGLQIFIKTLNVKEYCILVYALTEYYTFLLGEQIYYSFLRAGRL